jgi:hypothetical protein
MKPRFYAEAMYGSGLWQIVREDTVTGRLSIVRKDLQKEEAIAIAEEWQKTPDKVEA